MAIGHVARDPDVAREILIASDCDSTRTDDLLKDCLLESLRLFPPVTSFMERVVPDGGIVLGDTFLPAGTRVG